MSHQETTKPTMKTYMQIDKMSKYLYIFLLITGIISSCKKNDFDNDKNINKTPKTYMVVDTIDRLGSNRFNSQIKVQWWGNDEDGYIKGYKISTDLINWTFTTKQDSIFNIIIPSGKDTFDVRFYVKAIDNKNAEDINYASLAYPVKNSPPTIAFITPSGSAGTITKNPIKSFPVIKYSWIASDPDGSQDIDHIDICLNDTTLTPFGVDASTSEVTFLAENPNSPISKCKVYSGQSLSPLPTLINNLQTNQNNIIYIRSVDKVGSKSRFEASNSIYIKKVNSDILLVNAIASTSQKPVVLDFYGKGLIAQNKPVFDTLQAVDIVNNNYTELSVDNLTQSRVFGLFKHIIWITDDANFSLSFGQKTTSDFFKNGGNMLMSVGFTNNWDTTASWLDFTPARKLVPQGNSQTYRMIDQASVNNTQSGWPSLKFSTIGAPIVRPFFKFENNGSYTYEYLYNATIRITGGGPSYDWTSTDSTNVISKRINSSGKTNFIFSSIPLEKSNGNNNIDLFFKKVFIDELGF
ncbi:MAG: hypothetical protein HYZ42_06150 [Bacteroidetes bacterium]|nr:hypothetical protein [Bacteroidota bacterium]